MRALTVLLALALTVLAQAGSVLSESGLLPDGFYLVASSEDRTPRGQEKQLLPIHPAFLEPGGPEEVQVWVQPFVPILLESEPTRTPDPTERTQVWVGIELTDESARQLEEFTAEYLDRRVAIVVGGQVVSQHRIREVIRGGKVQISRCGDEGCQYLFQELQK